MFGLILTYLIAFFCADSSVDWFNKVKRMGKIHPLGILGIPIQTLQLHMNVTSDTCDESLPDADPPNQTADGG